MTQRAVKLLGFLVLAVRTLAADDPLDTWYWRSPQPQGNPLYGVCAGDDEFVAVGVLGTIQTSPDGRLWLNQQSGTKLGLKGICRGGGFYVAVGDSGLILTSPDARSWQPAWNMWLYNLSAVAWGNGRFVAVGEQGTIITSSDGQVWEMSAVGSGPLNGVTFGNGRWVAVGGHIESENSNPNLDRTPYLMTSSDGRQWLPQHPPTVTSLSAVHYARGLFVMAAWKPWYFNGAQIWHSRDGRFWQPGRGPLSQTITAFCTTSNRWYGGMADWLPPHGISTNGIDWSMEAGSGTCRTLGLAAKDDVVVGVGRCYPGDATMGLERKDPGDSIWQSLTPPEYPSVLQHVSWLGDKFFGFLPGHVWISASGAGWQDFSLETNLTFTSISAANGRYTAISADGLVGTSRTGTNWTITTQLFTPDPYNSWYDLAAGNGLFLASPVLTPDVHFSTDGINWTDTSLPEGSWTAGLAFGQGVFAIIDGSDSQLLISEFGTNWTKVPAGPFNHNSLRFSDGYFTALAANGGGFASTNGVEWQELQPPSPWAIRALIYGGGRFVGITYYPYALMASADGVNWSWHDPGIAQRYDAVEYGNQSFLLYSGYYQALVQSAPLSPTPPSVAQSPVSQVSAPGRPVVLQAIPYGSEPISFQWSRDGSPMNGAREAILVDRAPQESESHVYTVLLSNALGTAISEPARVTVGLRPGLTLGGTDPFRLELSGSVGLTYSVDYADTIFPTAPWRPWTNVLLTTPQLQLTSEPTGSTNRFYRARLDP